MSNGMFIGNRGRGRGFAYNSNDMPPPMGAKNNREQGLFGAGPTSYRDGFRDGYRDGLRGMNTSTNFRDVPNKGIASAPFNVRYMGQQNFNSRPGNGAGLLQTHTGPNYFRNQQHMDPQPPRQQYGGYEEDYGFYDQYVNRGRSSATSSGWFDGPQYRFGGPDFDRRPMNFQNIPHNDFNNQRGMARDENVLGYIGIHNMKKGKSGLFLISYINFLLRNRLMYNGPPVVFKSRVNENTLEAIFPNIDVLRGVVEKLSPITVKGNITVYVTYKPALPNNPPSAVAGLGHRRIQRTFTPSNRRLGMHHTSPQQHQQNSKQTIKAGNSLSKQQQQKKNKLKTPRLRGVFPDGVQPEKVVIVADELSPYVDLQQLRDLESVDVLTGNDCDLFDFLQVIHSDMNRTKDGVLYVIIPSLSLLLKQLKVFASNNDDLSAVNGDAKAVNGKTDVRKRGNKKALLNSIIAEFPDHLRSVDMEFMSKISAYTSKKIEDAVASSPLVELFARHLFYSAMFLRRSVRANTENSEVVFCGYPLHYMASAQVKDYIASKMKPEKCQELSEAILFAIRAFNEFAANTWVLGGFKISNFSEAKLVTQLDELDLGSSDEAKFSDADASTNGNKSSQVPEKESDVKLDPSEFVTDQNGVFALKSLARLSWLAEDADLTFIKKSFTEDVSTAVQRVCNFHKHKGAFVPWSPILAETFDSSNVTPDVVQESINTGVYSIKNTRDCKQFYYCNECHITVGDVVAADNHAYTRRHFNIVRRKVQQHAKNGGPKKSVLIGTAPAEVVVPLAKSFIEKLVNFKLVTPINSGGSTSEDTPKAPLYQCSACNVARNNSFDDANLRFHVHHYRHRMSVNTVFGLNTHRSLVSQHENWSLVQSLLRHPPCEVVMLADDRHEYSLKTIATVSTKINIFTYPKLLSSSTIWPSLINLGLTATDRRPALWLIVAGADVIDESKITAEDTADPVELLNPLVSLQTFLRVQLPVDHFVVTTPLMPLYLLSDALPVSATSKLLNALNCLVVPQQRMQPLTSLYSAVYRRAMGLHKSTSIHSNICSLNHLRCLPVTNVTDVKAQPTVLDSPWHVAVRSLIATALYGMPSMFLRPYYEPHPNLEELELDSRIGHVTVVAPQVLLKKGSRFESDKNLIIQRSLQFTDDDVDFLGSKAVSCEEGNYTVWYLLCDLPKIFMQSKHVTCCADEQCNKPLMTWVPRPEPVSELLLKISRFLCLLQSRMHSGNFVTLMPLFPTKIVCVPSVDSVTHSAMHQLQANTVFYIGNSADVRKAVDEFKQGWTDMFLKTNLHYTMPLGPFNLTPIEVVDLQLTTATSLKEAHTSEVQSWLQVFNYLLRNFSSRLNAVFSDEMAAFMPVKEDTNKSKDTKEADSSNSPLLPEKNKEEELNGFN